MKRQNFTIADIRSKYSEEKKKLDRPHHWLYFVVRPISFYFTWLFLRLGISANQTTLMSFVTSIIGCVFVALGNYWAIVVGATLLNIGFLLDIVDGNIARCTNTCTTYGHYVDTIGGLVIYGIIPTAVGLGLYGCPDPYLNYLSNLLFGVGVSNNLYLLLGVLWSFFMIIRFLISAEFVIAFSTNPGDFHKSKPAFKRNIWGFIVTLGGTLEATLFPILLVAAIAKMLSIFIVLWILLAACGLTDLATRVLIKARKIEKGES